MFIIKRHSIKLCYIDVPICKKWEHYVLQTWANKKLDKQSPNRTVKLPINIWKYYHS